MQWVGHWKDLDYGAKIMLMKWWKKWNPIGNGSRDRQTEVKRSLFSPKKEEDIRLVHYNNIKVNKFLIFMYDENK